MRRPRYVKCPNCGRITTRRYSCLWCNYPILLGSWEEQSQPGRPVKEAFQGRESGPRFFYGYIVVFVSCLVLIITQGLWYSFGVFFKPVSQDFGWTRAMTAGAFSLSTLFHGFIFIITGRLNDRFGPRMIITTCGLFLGLGYLLMSQISALWQLYLYLGVIIAIVQGSAFIPLTATVSRWFTKRRGVMTGIVAAGSGFGILFMPPIANYLITTYDWSVAYMITGIVGLVIIVLVGQFLRRDPSQVGQVPYGEANAIAENSIMESKGLLLGEAVRRVQFWLIALVCMCFNFAIFVVIVHLAPHATDLGMSDATGANILATVGLSSVIGKVSMGWITDRIGGKKALLIGVVIMLSSLTGFLYAREVWSLGLFTFIFGYSYGAFFAIQPLIIGQFFGMKALSTIYGAYAPFVTVAGAVGPTVAGRIFDVTGSYELAFLLCIIIMTACFLPLYFLKQLRDIPV